MRSYSEFLKLENKEKEETNVWNSGWQHPRIVEGSKRSFR